MSDGNRSQLADAVTVLFFASVLFFSAWAVWDWSASYTKNAIEADQAARQYAADAPERIKRECTVPATQTECITKIIQTTQENQRAEYDLSAQQDMAKWAWWMVAVSLLSTAVTAIGIYFVRENLLEIRTTNKYAEDNARSARAAAQTAYESNQIARRAASRSQTHTQQQLRAYICVDRARIVFPDSGPPTAYVTIKNYGQTPANSVRIWIHTWLERHPLSVNLSEPPADFLMAKMLLGPSATLTHQIIHIGAITPESMAEILAGNAAIYVYGKVEYNDVFGDNQYTRYRLFHREEECRGERLLMPHYEGNEAGIILEGKEYPA